MSPILLLYRSVGRPRDFKFIASGFESRAAHRDLQLCLRVTVDLIPFARSVNRREQQSSGYHRLSRYRVTDSQAPGVFGGHAP